jgi:hypothetical protein
MPSFELTFEERPGYLYARVVADAIDRQAAAEYLLDVAAKCEELSCSRLVLDRDIPTILNASDLFFTTKEFLPMMVGISVAFLNRHETIENEMEFAVMVARNRGADFKVVRDLAAAEEWLLGN